MSAGNNEKNTEGKQRVEAVDADVQDVEAAVEEGVVVDNKSGKRASSGSSDESMYDLAAFTSFVFAILGICGVCCFGLFALPLPVLSMVAFIWGRKSIRYKQIAVAGMVIAVVDFILAVCMICFGLGWTSLSLFTDADTASYIY